MKKQLLAIVLTTASFSGFSQERSAAEKEMLEKRESQVKAANFTPNGNGAFSNVISNLSLSSELEKGVKGNAELKAGGKSWNGGLSLEQNIGKTATKATIFDFRKGLTPGTTIALNIQYMNWNPEYTAAERRAFNDVKAEFRRNNPAVSDLTADRNYMMENGTEKQKLILKKISNRNPVFYNLSVAFNKAKFSYATDSVSLKKKEETHFTPNVGFTVGFPFSVKNYLAFSYHFSKTYESADEMEFSRKFGTTNNTFSQTLSFGSPEYSRDHKVTAEYRQSFNNKGDTEPILAIAPAVTYGIESEKVAFTLPLYFIKGKTKGLQGGVNFGYLTSVKNKWTSFQEGFGAQFIISAPFEMFKQFSSKK
ncbi:hypothetical protein SAMN06265348_104166 [Pedobacter westerhofensis]|uniref:Uncharacterized protein n=1 Tax=Pedobacter westerhofensis TaxID=425512 RepID=A0A521CSV8_9SPHI|nr:hypothetical protein [Pedobacter westerhofensis]SMO62465.1 hypothetical protein SAMN06265348_104166 [Pedobacter westerhofensis]